jgi:hypothetical protein
MLHGSSFTLPPGQDLPFNTVSLLNTVPEEATALINDLD